MTRAASVVALRQRVLVGEVISPMTAYRPNWPFIIRDVGFAVFVVTTAVMLVRRIRG